MTGLSAIGEFAEKRATKKYQIKNEAIPYREFFKQAFPIMEPGTALKDNWHIDFLCDRLEQETRRIHRGEPKKSDIIINIMPRSLKSYICTILWNAWTWTVFPEIRFITLSYAYPLSVEHSSKTRDLIKSDWYQDKFGHVFDLKKSQDSKQYFTNTKGGERKASSVGGQLTGSGANILIFDDPVKPPKQGEFVINETEIREANSWHDSTAYNRVNDPVVDLRVYVMQRLAHNDMTGHLLAKKSQEYEHICIPGELTEDVKPESIRKFYQPDPDAGNKRVFFLDRFPKKVLLNYEENMLDNYPGQVLQRPVKEGGGIWKEEYFRKISYDDVPVGRFKSLTAWDLATNKKQKKTNSASAYVYGFKTKDAIYVMDVGYVWKEFPELIPYIMKKPEPHYIENKSAGKDAVPELQAKGITAYEYKNENKDKFQSAQFAAAKAKRLKVYVVDTIWEKLMNSKEQGILEFPAAIWDDVHDAFCIFMDKISEGMITEAEVREMLSANKKSQMIRNMDRPSFSLTSGSSRGGSFRGHSI